MPGKYLQQTPQAGSTDTVPAMLTPGEFVIRKDAADEIGRDKLHAMNNIDRLSGMSAITSYKPPQFQEGGEVKQPKKLFTKDFVPYDESEEWRAMAHRQERGKGLIGASGYSAAAGIPAAMLSGALGLSTPTLLAINALAGMAGYSKVGGDKSNLKRVAMGELPYKDVRFKSIDDKMHMSTKKGWKGLSDDVVSQIRANNPQEVLDHYGFQEGGEVEQPMPVGEAAGMEEMPVPDGERAYPQEPMDQLGLEDHEYAAYTEHGPDVYKYLAPKYKPKVQWTPYDAMVDAGSINPYEVDKDDFVVITRDMANALRAA